MDLMRRGYLLTMVHGWTPTGNLVTLQDEFFTTKPHLQFFLLQFLPYIYTKLYPLKIVFTHQVSDKIHYTLYIPASSTVSKWTL